MTRGKQPPRKQTGTPSGRIVLKSWHLGAVLSFFVHLSSMACYIWSLAGKMRAGHILSLAWKCTDDQAICIPAWISFSINVHFSLSLPHTPMNAHTSPLFIRVKTGALSFIISVTVAIATLSTASA